MILALASASFLQILGPADEEGTLLTADSLFDSLTKNGNCKSQQQATDQNPPFGLHSASIQNLRIYVVSVHGPAASSEFYCPSVSHQIFLK
jgi:hypothetical protein